MKNFYILCCFFANDMKLLNRRYCKGALTTPRNPQSFLGSTLKRVKNHLDGFIDFTNEKVEGFTLTNFFVAFSIF